MSKEEALSIERSSTFDSMNRTRTFFDRTKALACANCSEEKSTPVTRSQRREVGGRLTAPATDLEDVLASHGRSEDLEVFLGRHRRPPEHVSFQFRPMARLGLAAAGAPVLAVRPRMPGLRGHETAKGTDALALTSVFGWTVHGLRRASRSS